MKRLLVIAALTFMVGAPAFSQGEIKREGTTFVQVKSDKVTLKNDTKTQYTYKASDGKVYPIYLSKNGKAFVVRVSKKTGREYKQYLPEVTAQIGNPNPTKKEGKK